MSGKLLTQTQIELLREHIQSGALYSVETKDLIHTSLAALGLLAQWRQAYLEHLRNAASESNGDDALFEKTVLLLEQPQVLGVEEVK